MLPFNRPGQATVINMVKWTIGGTVHCFCKKAQKSYTNIKKIEPSVGCADCFHIVFIDRYSDK